METIHKDIKIIAETQTVYNVVDGESQTVAYKTTSLEQAIDFAETTSKILEKQGV